MGDHKRLKPKLLYGPIFCTASHKQWHLLWRDLQTVSYSHSPANSTQHLQ